MPNRPTSRSWLIAAAITIVMSAMACSQSPATSLDVPRESASESVAAGATLEYRNLSAFLHHVDSLRQDRRVLQERHRHLVSTITQDTPIFPWSGETKLIQEFVASGRAKLGTELELKAAAAKEILDTAQALSDGYKALQRRSMDYPAHTQEMRQLGLMYMVAFAGERRAVESWISRIVYGGDEGTTVLALLGHAAQIFDEVDRRIANILENADAQDLIALHAAWMLEETALDF